MLENISWGSYIIAIGVLLVIWYLVIGSKFYYVELKEFIRGDRKMKFGRLGNQENDCLSSWADIPEAERLVLLDTIEEVDELWMGLIKAIRESADRNFSKGELESYLRLLLAEHHFVKLSHARDLTNAFLIWVTQKYPQFVFSHSEVDALWEETV